MAVAASLPRHGGVKPPPIAPPTHLGGSTGTLACELRVAANIARGLRVTVRNGCGPRVTAKIGYGFRVTARSGCATYAGWRGHPSFGVCDPERRFSSGPAPSRVDSPALCPSTTAFAVPVNPHPSPPAPSPHDTFPRGLLSAEYVEVYLRSSIGSADTQRQGPRHPCQATNN